jgi:hypothetical protein
MNNFGALMTPREYVEEFGEEYHTLDELRERANAPDTGCVACELENAWKLAGTGLCFSCTTGEADASEDIELIPDEEDDDKPSGEHPDR